VKRLYACVALLTLLCSVAVAEPTPAPVREEIEAMLSHLEASACRFQRNGTWSAVSGAVRSARAGAQPAVVERQPQGVARTGKALSLRKG
jgi:hypothetical protein